MKNFIKIVLFVSLLFLSEISLSAQQPNASPSPELVHPQRIVAQKLWKENNYLATLLELERREAEYLAAPMLWADYLDTRSTQASFVGDFDAAYADEEKFYAVIEPQRKFRVRNAAEIEKSPLEGYTALSALDAIGSAAERRQIIIVNEEHRTPIHRALTHRLLAVLYAKGFRYLALETLREEDADLNRRGYATYESGYYTFDPVFGDIVRQAIKLGFKAVAYENQKTCSKPEDYIVCSNERELNQAQNIYDRILKNDPQAKILIHAGRDHALKGELMKGVFMMAGHLQKISGIEPFTVDQMKFSERRNLADELPLYRYATSKGLLLSEPTVFESLEKKFYRDAPNRYDLQVFTPRAIYASGRPVWLRLGGARREHRLNLKKLNLPSEKGVFKAAAPVLIQAFAANDGAGAIPVDQVLLRPGKEIPAVLLLPAGSFQIKAVDETEKVVGQYKFKRK